MTTAGRIAAAASRLDLRSDFVAPPTDAMLVAMAEAAAAPMGFGLREDAAQVALERRAADLLGMEDALLFPTCTMANLVAILLHVRRGQSLVTAADSHVATSEAGGLAGIGEALLQPMPANDGVIPIADLDHELNRAVDAQRSPAALIVLEDTHNRSGGQPLPAGYLGQVADLARYHGVAVHLDGARLFNAAIATGRSPAELAAGATTVAVSLNKGLGAPNGAMLAGTRDVVAAAVAWRQQLGGGIRPSGLLAAAGLVALDRLADLAHDHAIARELAVALAAIRGCSVDPERVRTNIVMIDLPDPTADAVLASLSADGVLAIAMTPRRIRLCTHRGIPRSAVAIIAQAFRRATAMGEKRHV